MDFSDAIWLGMMTGLTIVGFYKAFKWAHEYDNAAKARKEQEPSTDKNQ